MPAVSLQSHNTLGVAAKASYFCEANDDASLLEALSCYKKQNKERAQSSHEPSRERTADSEFR